MKRAAGRQKKRSSARPAAGKSQEPRKVRYAVVGLGYIAQAAVLPAFANARNSVLAALVSDDPTKLRTLGKRYGVESLYSYEQYERCLEEAGIDAVYIALPNSMHRLYTEIAASAGVHVLCEKPLAVTTRDCGAMIDACRRAGVRLMTAYRLHFETANLRAIELVRSGKIGRPHLFSSVFTMQVRDQGNIRLRSGMGGGPLYDIGIYCINAARGFFGAEPDEVFAYPAAGRDDRFREVPASIGAVLRYPGDRLASFVCSFAAGDVSSYRVVGDRGDICLEPAYEFQEPLAYRVTIDGVSREVELKKHDQFAAELVYFSECVRAGRRPEPSGEEGLADVRIIEALHRSVRTGRSVALGELRENPDPRPAPRQEMRLPPARRGPMVHAKTPSGE